MWNRVLVPEIDNWCDFKMWTVQQYFWPVKKVWKHRRTLLVNISVCKQCRDVKKNLVQVHQSLIWSDKCLGSSARDPIAIDNKSIRTLKGTVRKRNKLNRFQSKQLCGSCENICYICYRRQLELQEIGYRRYKSPNITDKGRLLRLGQKPLQRQEIGIEKSLKSATRVNHFVETKILRLANNIKGQEKSLGHWHRRQFPIILY